MSNRKTLKKQAFEYSETRDLYNLENAKAKANIIYGELKLKFLKWLETSGPGNSHVEWETEEHDKDHWNFVAWSQAIERFNEDLKSDEFYVDITGNVNNYTIRLGLWDKNDELEVIQNNKNIIRDVIKETQRIPHQFREELDSLFRGFFNLHEKDNNYDHPKYQEFRNLVSKLYKKNMTADKMKTLLLKGNKSTGISPLLGLLK